MSPGTWPPTGFFQKSSSDAVEATDEANCRDLQTHGPSRGRLFAVIARPFNLFGRGMSATANGMSTVVQSPVRVARGLRREDATTATHEVCSPTSQSNTLEGHPQEKARAAWNGFVGSVISRWEGAQQLIPSAQATSSTVLRRCWPAKLSLSSGSGTSALKGANHDLVSAGSRKLGVSRLQVNIYDFAVYMDSGQAKQSKLGRRSPWLSDPLLQQQLIANQDLSSRPKESPTAQPQRQPAFARALINSSDVDMSLVVRASRNLPLKMMMGEYERILRRRLNSVGGSPNDPALPDMLAAFSEDRLPKDMVKGGNVQKGSVLMFKKTAGGKVTAAADGQDIVTVSSPAFAAAVFDLYLGNRPVSPEARVTALDAAARMMTSSTGDAYAPVAGQPGMCAGSGQAGSCQRQPLWQPWQRVFQPS